MSIEPGRKLLHYEIVERIGEGGMGVVWKALDTTLGREVAIKVLPQGLAQNAERLARFEHEARVLASLNHANIASVFGLHTEGDVRFLAMELIEGEDVSQRIARGRLPIEETLGYARQIADALQTAHGRGIVHRDLKPANVMRASDGKIKVLDFGLAKAFEASSPDVNPSMSPTLTSHGTLAGVILGTAGYMSPEQARGEPADKRSDVFSFGVLLYEMLTGTRAFHGDSVTDTLASVLKLEPEWNLLPAGLPRGIPRLLRRCLQKNPDDRLHDIADARIEIVEALAQYERGESPSEEKPASGTGARWVVVAALVGLLAGGGLGWVLAPDAPDPPVRRFTVRAIDVTQQAGSPRISPDGRQLAYFMKGELYVRNLERGDTHKIEGPEEASHLFWSPDSSTIGYAASGKLWKIDVSGGTPTPICETESSRSAAWNDAGTIGIVDSNRLYEVPARGGDPVLVLKLDSKVSNDFHGIAALPDAAGWALLVHDSDGKQAVEVMRGTERQRLVEHSTNTTVWNPCVAPSGHILYTRGGSEIWAVPLSGGDAFLVAPEAAQQSVARDGTLAYRPAGPDIDLELIRVGIDGKVLETYGEPRKRMLDPMLSPDGRRILFAAEENTRTDLWTLDIERGMRQRLTSLEGDEGLARWTADGKEIYFDYPIRSPSTRTYRMPSDGDEEPREWLDGKRAFLADDGKALVFVRDVEGQNDVWRQDLESGAEPEPFVTSEEYDGRPVLSPDGKWVAYESSESGTIEIYVKPFPTGAGKWLASKDGGSRAEWSPDGSKLYFSDWGRGEEAIYVVDVEVGETLGLSAPRVFLDFSGPTRGVLWRGFDVFPDGKSVLMISHVEDDGEEDEDTIPEGIHIVQNWFEEFRD